jgi:hydrogenase maturation protein HypF
MENSTPTGLKIFVSGIVQGVGFRPFVYSCATKLNLTGSVRNSSSGVEIEAFGHLKDINELVEKISQDAPPLARIDLISTKEIAFRNSDSFIILESHAEDGEFLPVSPDMSICPDCLRELFDPTNRRYRYPFINCTNCGPRFSIVRDIPYDRPMTTMKDFELCPACRQEYENPLDRRFHAQPVACATCGPRLQFISQGQIIGKYVGALGTARQFIEDGKIVAIKGLGGYHLACDAANQDAVNELRKRKIRSERPFALMSFDLKTIRENCEMSDKEQALLDSAQRPIVLLKKLAGCDLPEELAPQQNHLGFMLPYTPLHYLLLEPDEGFPRTLVMTSGNMSDEPIAFEDDEALERHSGIADGFLVHNRPIHMRVDDSVVRIFQNAPYYIRRSRGYAPNPVLLKRSVPEILACGAELKNTFCLSRDQYAFVSHHIGDLENYETLQSYEGGIRHYQKLFRITPKVLAADLHPDYLSTKYAIQRAETEELPLVRVQHHHAHLAACLAENHFSANEPVIGLIFDGTGYGEDSKIWGGEILIGSYESCQRKFHLAEVPLPGGDTAIRNPSKIALATLFALDLPWTEDLGAVKEYDPQELLLLRSQLNNKINCPMTTSMGRLFDAVASLLNVRHKTTYEGQAAIELENICRSDEDGLYHFSLREDEITFDEVIVSILSDLRSGVSAAAISARFHNGLARLCLDVCQEIQMESGMRTVALSGGVWQNITLLNKTIPLLKRNGFQVLIHITLPAIDGGIALGQLMVAAQQRER